MRVERHRVGQLDPGNRRPASLAQRGEAAVGAIDVQPQPAFTADGRQLAEPIDRAGVGRARIGSHDQRLAAGFRVGVDRANERVNAEPVGRVGWEDADLVRHVGQE